MNMEFDQTYDAFQDDKKRVCRLCGGSYDEPSNAIDVCRFCYHAEHLSTEAASDEE